MAHRAGEAQPPKAGEKTSKAFNIFMVVGAALVLIGAFGSKLSGIKLNFGSSNSNSPPPVSSERPERMVTITKTLHLHPCRWSDPISIAELKPPEVPDNARFQYQVNTPDCMNTGFGMAKEKELKKTFLNGSGKFPILLSG